MSDSVKGQKGKAELVSVIIPTYRRSSILKAVESVICQDYPSVEIIVVDDNAEYPEYREATKKTLSAYIESGQVRLIQNKVNLGGALSRNAGIEASFGEYIVFLDDDDWYLPEKITKQVEVLKSSNASIVYCWSRGEDTQGNILWTNTKSIEGNLLIEAMTDCIANTSLIMCSREALESVDLFSDSPCKQDVLLELKLASKGYTFACVKEILVVFGSVEQNFKRLSNVSGKTLIGMNKVRDYARSQYHKLTADQISFVEGDTAYKICMIAVSINDQHTFDQEYRVAIKNKNSLRRKISLLYHKLWWKK